MDIIFNWKSLKRWNYLVTQKNGENIPSLEVIKLVLVQCNQFSPHNQYQQKFDVLCFINPMNLYIP